jgi:hypothetical protein
MNRTQLTLAALLIVQLLLIVLLRAPLSGAAGPTQLHALLPVLEAVTPTQLHIVGADDEEVTLAQRAEGWVVEELDGFPADAAKIKTLIDDLRGLKVRRPVVSGSRFHETFKVADDEFEARLQLWDDTDDDPKVDLILGTSPTYRAVHVRLAAEDPVYEVRGVAAYDVRPDAGTWVDRQLVDVPAERVVGIAVENETGSFEIAKRDGAWVVVEPETMQGLTLDADEVSNLVDAVSSISLAEPVGPSTGDERETGGASVTLRVEPDPGAVATAAPLGTVIVQVGASVEDNESQRYVSRSEFGFVGTVWESAVRDLLESQIQDLMPDDLDSEDASSQVP